MKKFTMLLTAVLAGAALGVMAGYLGTKLAQAALRRKAGAA